MHKERFFVIINWKKRFCIKKIKVLLLIGEDKLPSENKEFELEMKQANTFFGDKAMKGFHYCKNMNNFYYSKLEVTFFIKKILLFLLSFYYYYYYYYYCIIIIQTY